MTETFWNFIRPFHAPFTRRLRARLGSGYLNHPEMVLPPAHEAIQLEAERRLHAYLRVDPLAIRDIVIVGANEAEEIPRLQHTYPAANFLCFEPLPASFRRLEKKFAGQSNVTCRSLALSDQPGRACFYEIPGMEGNGSLLEPDLTIWSRQSKRETPPPEKIEVTVSTLDAECGTIPAIDLLWIDVQGAEMRVLSGGTQTLRRTRAVLIEVWLGTTAYRGTAGFEQVTLFLNDHGLECCGLGIDPWNSTGNAMFLRPSESHRRGNSPDPDSNI